VRRNAPSAPALCFAEQNEVTRVKDPQETDRGERGMYSELIQVISRICPAAGRLPRCFNMPNATDATESV